MNGKQKKAKPQKKSVIPNIRVLHVYRTYFPNAPGGIPESIRQISLSTQPFGIDSKIFTLSPTPSPGEIEYTEGRVVRCKSWGAPASCDIGDTRAFSQFRKMSKWADVIHYHYPWPFMDLLRLFAIDKPSVMTYHSDIVRQRILAFFYRPLMKHTLRAMKAVVATSPAYAVTSPVLSKLVSPKNLFTIPLGIMDYRSESKNSAFEKDYLRRFSLKPNSFVLALGALRYYKGLHTLVEASALTKATIVIAGSGTQEERLKKLARDLGAANVIFTGQVSNEEKIALLRGCRLLALPSHLRSEAFGMVLVEASMFGKPMISCEIGSGTSFVNEHRRTGFVIPPESPSELAAAVNKLFADDALTKKMGIASRNRYEKLFSGPALGLEYSKLYKKVVQ